MRRELSYAVQYVLGWDRAGRDLTIFTDDTFIVSFPRSGNTWTRFLVANLSRPEEPVTFRNIEDVIPDIYAHSKRRLKGVARPRLLKSHEYFDPRYRRTIYIVRDPRDVVLSSYHFHLKQRQITDQCPIEKYVSDFVAGSSWNYGTWGENVISWLAARQNQIGANDLCMGDGSVFGNWGENVSSWLATRLDNEKFLLVRYEDMLSEPLRELARVAAFLGIRATPERLAEVVELSSADLMRELERTEGSKWIMTKKTRKDIPFVRVAASGGWRDKLPQSCVAAIESAWGPLMIRLGYELSSSNNENAKRDSEEAKFIQTVESHSEFVQRKAVGKGSPADR